MKIYISKLLNTYFWSFLVTQVTYCYQFSSVLLIFMSVNWSTMNFVFFKTHNCQISYISEFFNAIKTKFLERKIDFITWFHHITTIQLEDKYQQIRSMKSVNFFYACSYCIKFHYILDTTVNYIWYYINFHGTGTKIRQSDFRFKRWWLQFYINVIIKEFAFF